MRSTKLTRLGALLAVLALVAAACGGGGAAGDTTTTAAPDDTPSTEAPPATDAPPETEADGDTGGDEPEPVTIEWWHIQNQGAMLELWQTLADEFVEMNPHVTFDIVVNENEAFKDAIQPRLQSNDPPDLFQSWGGGDLADQVEAGLVRDISSEVSGWIDNLSAGAVSLFEVDGGLYAVPFDLGMVGFWYNKELFAQAGIDAPPTTWDEFLEDVQTLKDAGITPIAVGGQDKWPAHFYLAYLILRIGGQQAIEEIATNRDFDHPAVIEAGNQLQRLVDLDPFQEGFLASPWPGPDGEAGWIGTGQAAISLMGQWGPGEYANSGGHGEPDQLPSERLPFEMSWFPFPEVEGGVGDLNDGIGGGNGFAVGADAPPEAIEFLEYITSVENARRTGETGAILPVTKGAEDSVTEPLMVPLLESLASSEFVQLYLDQYFPAAVGEAINDETQKLFAGQATIEDAIQAINAAFASS
ncbi:MAG TPA: extracellular solute-binding protein [Acidimicrobiia bacterium]|nr:extracellular solute-binding protein [Acidimicrobiia bacterium]